MSSRLDERRLNMVKPETEPRGLGVPRANVDAAWFGVLSTALRDGPKTTSEIMTVVLREYPHATRLTLATVRARLMMAGISSVSVRTKRRRNGVKVWYLGDHDAAAVLAAAERDGEGCAVFSPGLKY